MSKTAVRVVAAQLLKEVLTNGRSLTGLLPEYAEKVPEQDKAFLQALCKGVCRWQPRYRLWLLVQLKKPLKSKDKDIEALVYLGLFQLLELRIPDHAAIAETVEAAKKLRKVWAKSLLNALLRKVQREGLSLPQKTDSFEHAHPDWLTNQIKQAWPKHWRTILEANNTQAPMTLRVNRQQGSRDQYSDTLHALGIDHDKSTYAPDGLILAEAQDALSLPGFKDGEVSIQDEAAQLAAGLLDAQTGHTVLDACCAPGGKTGHILESLVGAADVIAIDQDSGRLQKVEENLERLKLRENQAGKVRLDAADIADLDAWWDKHLFDRILLDAPCSATGVIRRHPDIKLLRRASDIEALAKLQLTLLQTLWHTLRPGGRLVYATCSVMPDENEQVIAHFIRTQNDASQIDIDLDCGIKRTYGIQLFPQIDGHDGFYYAVLSKHLPN